MIEISYSWSIELGLIAALIFFLSMRNGKLETVIMLIDLDD